MLSRRQVHAEALAFQAEANGGVRRTLGFQRPAVRAATAVAECGDYHEGLGHLLIGRPTQVRCACCARVLCTVTDPTARSRVALDEVGPCRSRCGGRAGGWCRWGERRVSELPRGGGMVECWLVVAQRHQRLGVDIGGMRADVRGGRVK